MRRKVTNNLNLEAQLKDICDVASIVANSFYRQTGDLKDLRYHVVVLPD